MVLGAFQKIAISWGIITSIGVYAFYISRQSVIAKRVEHMKIRQRISASNSGEYTPSIRKYARD